MLSGPIRRLLFFAALALAVGLALMPGGPQILPEDKEDHGLAFALLMAGAAFAWPRARLLAQFALLAGLGAAIEIAQLLPALHRDSEIADWYADCAAAGIVALIIHRYRQSRAPTGLQG